MSWRRIDKRLLLILLDESLVEHGGASGLRDEGLLDSALARPPLNLPACGDPDAAEFAAGEIDEAEFALWIRGNGAPR